MDATASIVAGLFILGLPLLLVFAQPLFRPQKPVDSGAPSSPAEELLTERERSYTALADLDFDYECGKLDDKDYRQLRAALMQETAEILARIDGKIAQQQARESRQAQRAPAHPRERPTPVSEDAIEREIARFKRAREGSRRQR
jgi:hypothetical protein